MTSDNKNFRLFAGTAHHKFAEEISALLREPLSKVTIKKFSCGEIFVNLEDSVRGKDVFIISTMRSGSVNEDFMETFIMCDAAKRSFAKKVHVILPHFGYARQDKIHFARESITAKLMANLLVQSGADHLITLHLHADQIQAFFDIPVDNVYAKKLLADVIIKEKIKNPIIVTPDAGGAKYAKKFADLLSFDLAILHKSRPEHNKAQVSHVIGDVKDKTPILVDDMIDTAGSVISAKEALIKAGSNKNIYLVATHAIFSGPAIERLKEANFKKIFITNSLPLSKEAKELNIQVVSAAPLIASVIENVLQDRSVSKLFF